MYGFASRGGEERIEFAYWRKHYELHEWMERLYRERGGTEQFNCVPLPLSLEDIDRLQADTASNADVSEWTRGQRQRVLDFIALARRYIAEGYSVFYDSFW